MWRLCCGLRLKRLRQDTQALGLPVIKAQSIRRFVMSFGNNCEATAHHLGIVRSREERDENNHPQDQINLLAGR